MGELLVRMVVSLAVVVGLLILLSRVAARRFQGRSGSTIEVLHRQALGKAASVSIVSVAGRVLVLGTTEQQVNVLTELDPDALELAELATGGSGEESAEDGDGAWDQEWDEEVEELDSTLLPSPVLAGTHRGTEQVPSLEALLAEPDLVTLEELLGRPAPVHTGPSHAAPVGAAYAAAPAAPVAPSAPAAAVAALDEEDPILPEDPSYAAFASQLRAQLASGQLAGDQPSRPEAVAGSGRHAAPAPVLELPPVVSGGARAARPLAEAPLAAAPLAAPLAAPAVAPATPAAAPAAGTAAMAADIAALRAALLAAQLQAATPAPAAPAGRPSRAERRAAQARAAALAPQDQGALAGSVLSPTTWKQAFRAVNHRAS